VCVCVCVLHDLANYQQVLFVLFVFNLDCMYGWPEGC